MPVPLRQIQISTGHNLYVSLSLGPHPDRCPRCGNGIEPRVIPNSEVLVRSGQDEFQIAYQCTFRACGELFLGIFRRQEHSENTGQFFYLLETCEPKRLAAAQRNRRIERVSSTFYDVYNQALSAETLGLTEVAGLGYRSALERLIKDWLIGQRTEIASDAARTADEKRKAEHDIAAINGATLRACIADFIAPQDEDIRMTADATEFIGNDEMRYARRPAAQDLEQIKALIETTALWIERKAITKTARIQ